MRKLMNALAGAATFDGRFGFGTSVQFVMASLNVKLAIATLSMPAITDRMTAL